MCSRVVYGIDILRTFDHTTHFFHCVFLSISSFPACCVFFCNAYVRSHRESNKNENIGICKATNYVKRYSSLNTFVFFSHEQCFSCRSTSQPISSEKVKRRRKEKINRILCARFIYLLHLFILMFTLLHSCTHAHARSTT